MQFIYAKNTEEPAKIFAEELKNFFWEEKRILWLVCGGFNIKAAKDIMDFLAKDVDEKILKNLTIMQTDERYGAVGHKDSNWKQMIDAGFDFKNVKNFPILVGLSEEKTIIEYSKIIKREFAKAEKIFALFGMGADGHIAGILPHSPAVSSKEPVSIYKSEPFIRVTLTPPFLRKIDVAYALVFGDSKREAVLNLRDKNLSLEDEPAQILKELPSAKLYSDQLL